MPFHQRSRRKNLLIYRRRFVRFTFVGLYLAGLAVAFWLIIVSELSNGYKGLAIFGTVIGSALLSLMYGLVVRPLYAALTQPYPYSTGLMHRNRGTFFSLYFLLVYLTGLGVAIWQTSISSDLTPGARAGIGAGIAIFTLLTLTMVWLLLRWRNKRFNAAVQAAVYDPQQALDMAPSAQGGNSAELGMAWISPPVKDHTAPSSHTATYMSPSPYSAHTAPSSLTAYTNPSPYAAYESPKTYPTPKSVT